MQARSDIPMSTSDASYLQSIYNKHGYQATQAFSTTSDRVARGESPADMYLHEEPAQRRQSSSWDEHGLPHQFQDLHLARGAFESEQIGTTSFGREQTGVRSLNHKAAQTEDYDMTVEVSQLRELTAVLKAENHDLKAQRDNAYIMIKEKQDQQNEKEQEFQNHLDMQAASHEQVCDQLDAMRAELQASHDTHKSLSKELGKQRHRGDELERLLQMQHESGGPTPVIQGVSTIAGVSTAASSSDMQQQQQQYAMYHMQQLQQISGDGQRVSADGIREVADVSTRMRVPIPPAPQSRMAMQSNNPGAIPVPTGPLPPPTPTRQALQTSTPARSTTPQMQTRTVAQRSQYLAASPGSMAQPSPGSMAQPSPGSMAQPSPVHPSPAHLQRMS